MSEVLTCRICNSEELKKSFYPSIKFNDKIFDYMECEKCKSFNVFPNPTAEDFEKIYGENDHTYLSATENKLTYPTTYPKGHYHGYQLDFLEEIGSDLKGKRLLDFASGSGFYLDYAQKLGAEVVGIEFDEQFIKLLKTKSDFNIMTLHEAVERYKDLPFDFIHMGHVLEHLTNPSEILEELKKVANKDTTFLFDGPLERNACLSRFYIDFGSWLKSKKYNEYEPQHLTLTTYKSQLDFFKKHGLMTEKYVAVEQYFPLPDRMEKSFFAKVNYVIASLSIMISNGISSWGNIFHFRGKLK